MNSISIKGRLVRDPELKTVASGDNVCNITVAVDRNFSSKNGERECDFFDCIFWRQGADFVSKYFRKGQEIIVQGAMQSRKWKDKDGNNRISWEIQNCHAEFCGSKNDTPKGEASYAQSNTFIEVVDDGDLPF